MARAALELLLRMPVETDRIVRNALAGYERSGHNNICFGWASPKRGGIWGIAAWTNGHHAEARMDVRPR